MFPVFMYLLVLYAIRLVAFLDKKFFNYGGIGEILRL